MGGTVKKNEETKSTEPPKPYVTVFGTTHAEEFALYNKWCRGYPDNRKNVP